MRKCDDSCSCFVISFFKAIPAKQDLIYYTELELQPLTFVMEQRTDGGLRSRPGAVQTELPLLWVSAAGVCRDDGHRSAFPPGGKFHPRILLHWIRFKCVFTLWETAAFSFTASSTALALKLQNQRWQRVTAPQPTRRGRPSLYLIHILNYATRHTYCHCDRAPSPLTGWTAVCVCACWPHTSVCCLMSNEILLWHQKSGKVQVPFIPSQYPLQWPVMAFTTGLFRITNWFSHLWKWHFPCSMSGRPNQTKAHISTVHHVTPRRKTRRRGAGTKTKFGLQKNIWIVYRKQAESKSGVSDSL